MQEVMNLTDSNKKVWFELSIKRGPITNPLKQSVGLIINVKARPEVEEFFHNSANGKTIEVGAIAAGWAALDSKPLEVYQVAKAILPLRSATVHLPGRELLINNGAVPAGNNPFEDGNGQVINLSFLRLVGIAQPSGVTFGLVGAYSKNFIRQFSTLMLPEVSDIVRQYITPLEFHLSLVEK